MAKNNQSCVFIFLLLSFLCMNCGNDLSTNFYSQTSVSLSTNLRASCAIRCYNLDNLDYTYYNNIGSGFAINDSVIVTAGHVTAAIAANYKSSGLIVAFFPYDSIFVPIKRLVSNPDFAVLYNIDSWGHTFPMVSDVGYLLAVDSLPFHVCIATSSEIENLTVDDSLFAIVNQQTPLLSINRGGFLYFNNQGLITDKRAPVFYSTVDSYPGASGSPVFNSYGILVGILVGSYADDISISVTATCIDTDPFINLSRFTMNWSYP